MWGTLQFRFLQRELAEELMVRTARAAIRLPADAPAPLHVQLLERLLLAMLPYPVTALVTWAVASAAGVTAVPYVLGGCLAVCTALCSSPLPSSFGAGRRGSVVGEPEAAAHLACMVLLPAASVVALHWPSLELSAWLVSELGLAAAGPLLVQRFVASLSPRLLPNSARASGEDDEPVPSGVLWWLGASWRMSTLPPSPPAPPHARSRTCSRGIACPPVGDGGRLGGRGTALTAGLRAVPGGVCGLPSPDHSALSDGCARSVRRRAAVGVACILCAGVGQA